MEKLLDLWIDMSEHQPVCLQTVYVVCETDGGKRYQTMATYVPYMEVLEEDFMSEDFHTEGDYNEEEDVYYAPAGFYEYQTVPDMSWKISDTVLYWMPLLPKPEKE